MKRGEKTPEGERRLRLFLLFFFFRFFFFKSLPLWSTYTHMYIYIYVYDYVKGLKKRVTYIYIDKRLPLVIFFFFAAEVYTNFIPHFKRNSRYTYIYTRTDSTRKEHSPPIASHNSVL